jgi:hypothetical protein
MFEMKSAEGAEKRFGIVAVLFVKQLNQAHQI